MTSLSIGADRLLERPDAATTGSTDHSPASALMSRHSLSTAHRILDEDGMPTRKCSWSVSRRGIAGQLTPLSLSVHPTKTTALLPIQVTHTEAYMPFINVHIHIHTYTCSHTHTHTHTHMHTHAHRHADRHADRHTHACTHAYTHTQIRRRSQLYYCCYCCYCCYCF